MGLFIIIIIVFVYVINQNKMEKKSNKIRSSFYDISIGGYVTNRTEIFFPFFFFFFGWVVR